ncbi:MULTISPECIES: hypothetical protein [Streptomyces]|uniref:hypothetical protein n=1 Tax=Streptomyces TaxID=1883 RepID=UPI000F78F263|nr:MULTISPECIES: hypothetical protein [Streptomyces]RST01801.1 hypothetical protein EF910_26020 [Streptomyces sp. WAC07149]GLX23575.1 hypothetical protein Slala01_72190 [Streptomyces lavendulae subsp. lavendulae]GLX31377.1 hypothetical protein Slala02_71960 [Streptomyces lavendulae subsp. lavendulae]
MRGGRGAGGRVVALAVGVPLAVAGIVVAAVLPSGGGAAAGPLHRAVDAYLDAAGGGGPGPAAARGGTCPAGGEDPVAVLRRLAPAFGHRIVSSTESGDRAAVNVDLLPRTGDRVAVALELRRSGERWDVCAASTGHVEIDPF